MWKLVMISSVKENILKYTHMLNTTADRTSGNKVDTELLRILAELFFVSQEVSEMLAARLKMIIKIDDLECFCIKCQQYVMPAVDSLLKKSNTRVDASMLAMYSVQKTYANQILKSLGEDHEITEEFFKLLADLRKAIAKYLKQERRITSNHEQNHMIELHLITGYRYCGICKVFFHRNEDLPHKHLDSKSNLVEKLDPLNLLSVDNHALFQSSPQTIESNSDAKQKKPKRVTLKPILIRFCKDLESIMKKICTKSEELEKFEQYIPMSIDLRRLFKTNRHDKVEIYLSGSRMYGLGNSKSDLDIFVNIDNSFEGRDEKKIKLLILEAIELLSSQPLKWSICKNPGLSAFNKELKIYCNISFNSGLDWANTKLIQHYFAMQPESIKLAHFVQLWFDNSDIEWPLEHHTLVVMLIVYLQYKQYLPKVQLLQKSSKITIKAENFRVDFDKECKLQDFELFAPINDYKKLLAGFFHFYYLFDFRSKFISPFFGNSHRRKLIKMLEITELANFDFNATMIVLDLFNYSKNLTSEFSVKGLRKFKYFCRISRNRLVKSFGFSKSN